MYSRVAYFAHAALALALLLVQRVSVWVQTRLLGHERRTASKDMTGQVVVVTGANTGIGKMTARKLASCGALVVMACRDDQRGLEAAADINAHLKAISATQPLAAHGKAQYMRLDLGDLRSVLDFCARFRRSHRRLDVLVNNAGLNSDVLLSTGLQQLFQVNYLGHFLLTRGLLDLLTSTEAQDGRRAPRKGRVVNLSSVMHHNGQPNFKLSAFNQLSAVMKSNYSYYSDSKLYMNLLTLQLNQMLSDEDRLRSSALAGPDRRPVAAVSANPGAVSSDIWRNVPLRRLFDLATSLVFLDTDEGSETSFRAATVSDTELDAYMQSHSWHASISGRMCQRGDLPYVVPYASLLGAPLLAAEMLGPFAGSRFAPATLPTRCSRCEMAKSEYALRFSSPQDLARQLWTFSAETSVALLKRAGADADDVAFLTRDV